MSANSKSWVSESARRTLREYVRGIDFCIDNAKRLLFDANLLDRRDRIASAIGLAIFAQEEVGKAVMLIADLLDGRRIRKKDWQPGGKFMKHLTKLSAPSRYRSLLGSQTGVHHETAVMMEMSKLFQEGKLRCFYVDLSPSPATSGWSSPTDPRYMNDLKLLVGSAIPLAEGWLRVIEPFWKQKKQTLLN